MAAGDAERRIAAQAGLVERVRAVPGVVVVDASGDRGPTEALVAAAYAAALARAGTGPT